LLIQGGMISSGRFHCSLVVGLNWSSWIISFWKITLPGVEATFLPISKADGSVILTRSWPPPSSMSRSRLLKPLSRFWPLLLTVSRSTSGLVMAKFDGARASMNWRVKKFTFLREISSRSSTLVTESWMWRAVIR
jgi:hypothetical protein